MLLQKYAGAQGSANAALGLGFGPREVVRAYWTPGTMLLGSGTTNLTGTVGLTFTVPLSPSGQYHVAGLGLSSHGVATVPFYLVPALYVAPASGTPGAPALVVGTGFKAGDTVTVKWDCPTARCASTTVLGAKRADTRGDVSLGATIPATAPTGGHAIGALGAPSQAFAATVYTVRPPPTPLPTATRTPLPTATGTPRPSATP